jgi:hypothetical protein
MAAGRLCGDRPGVTGAAPDQRFAMYELISIPKRNTTAAGVTHFMCKFLVLISGRTPVIEDLGSKNDWLAWQGLATGSSVLAAAPTGPLRNLESDLMIFMIPGRPARHRGIRGARMPAQGVRWLWQPAARRR